MTTIYACMSAPTAPSQWRYTVPCFQDISLHYFNFTNDGYTSKTFLLDGFSIEMMKVVGKVMLSLPQVCHKKETPPVP